MNQTAQFLLNFWNSSIGKKIVVALTGLVLVLFLLGHLSGNMLLYVGEKAFNEYAYFLHHMLHGAGVWIARIVLLVCFVLHIVGTVQLTKQNRAANQTYKVDGTQRSSFSSKVMIWTGLTVLAFVIYHILHYTVRFANDYNGERYDIMLDGHKAHNAYLMVVDGFNWLPATIFYLISVSLLCSHLSHGTASIFQTLGLRTKKTESVIDIGSKLYSLVIWIGFISIPLAVLFKIVK